MNELNEVKQESVNETIVEKVEQTISELAEQYSGENDERLKYLPKDQRKQIKRFLKAKERTRTQSEVVFAGLYANRSARGASIIMHISPEMMRADGLHLSISLKDIEAFLEDAITAIRVYEIRPRGD